MPQPEAPYDGGGSLPYPIGTERGKLMLCYTVLYANTYKSNRTDEFGAAMHFRDGTVTKICCVRLTAQQFSWLRHHIP
jgi:hypothetical protein